jgi:hypothetical protein
MIINHFQWRKGKIDLMERSSALFNEEDIGKQTIIILTSIMIQSPRFKGTFFYIIYNCILLLFYTKCNICIIIC